MWVNRIHAVSKEERKKGKRRTTELVLSSIPGFLRDSAFDLYSFRPSCTFHLAFQVVPGCTRRLAVSCNRVAAAVFGASAALFVSSGHSLRSLYSPSACARVRVSLCQPRTIFRGSGLAHPWHSAFPAG